MFLGSLSFVGWWDALCVCVWCVVMVMVMVVLAVEVAAAVVVMVVVRVRVCVFVTRRERTWGEGGLGPAMLQLWEATRAPPLDEERWRIVGQWF